MNSLKINLKLNKSVNSGDQVIMDIEQFPFPTVIYFYKSNEVVINKLASEILGINEKDGLDIDKWKTMNSYLDDEINKISSHRIINDRKVHVVNFNGKHEIINYSIRRFHNTSHGEIMIIHFNKASEKYTAAAISSLYTIMDNVSKLKPYLNKTGKNMLDEILKEYQNKENPQLLTLDDLVYYEKELRIIQKAYPLLSHREVILCGLLVNNIDSQDIAVITNRSIDAVFVNIHRINKKLNYENKKELVSSLRDLINNEEKMQSA